MRRPASAGIIAAAIVAALLALPGCSGKIHPFGKGSDAPAYNPFHKAPPVTVVAADGIPDEKRARLAQYIDVEAKRRGISVKFDKPSRSDFRMSGKLTAASGRSGTLVAYVWDVVPPDENPAERITGEEKTDVKAKGDAWKVVDDAMLFQIALNTADRLSSYLGRRGYYVRNVALMPPPDTEDPTYAMAYALPGDNVAPGQTPPPPAVASAGGPAATASIASAPSIKPILLQRIKGVSDADSKALLGAMRAALKRRGAKTTARAKDSLQLKTSIGVSPPIQGLRSVSIAWNVHDRGGALIGTVKQNNKIPAKALARGWSPIAEVVADAAVDGVVDLMMRAK